MTKIQYFLHSLGKAFNFTGRSSFDEFISFVLIYLSWNMINFVINTFLSLSDINIDFSGFGVIFSFLYLGLIGYCTLAFIALLIRRIHDLGKNFLYLFIPFYNFLLLMQDGEKKENKYGKIPL
jgi:uncharacterized membrane protein YhaH (DUF805 family)